MGRRRRRSALEDVILILPKYGIAIVVIIAAYVFFHLAIQNLPQP